VSLALSFERAVEANEVKETLEQVENLEVVPPPLGLDGVPDSDSISVAPPSLSAEGSQLALVLMVDGLRIGGALTACDILDSMF
jgi:hypothetical protein